MADPINLAILKRGAKAWNLWRAENPARPDLRESDLVAADLSKMDLNGANLEGALLSGADFRMADLSGGSLRRADLVDANLVDTDLFHADLSGANLREANLIGANLRKAQLAGANLSRAIFDETVLSDVDLSQAIGLESCFHVGPSVLDYRTLARSRNLPLAFLRGCGLPDILIEYLPSLLNEPIQFYSCFISYSTKDQDFAERLHADLQNKGVRCWFAPHNIQGGKKLHEQIDEAIRIYDRLLLILSDHSMNSEWVQTEIAKARKRERTERRRMLFPVRLVDFNTIRDWECFHADAGKDSAQEIREYYIPDFSNWKDHDSYQRELEKLLRDLKSEEKLSPP